MSRTSSYATGSEFSTSVIARASARFSPARTPAASDSCVNSRRRATPQIVRLGGLGGTLLVVGVRCSFRGKDAGSVNSEELLARLRTQHRDEERGPTAQRMFRQALLFDPAGRLEQGPWFPLGGPLLAHATRERE